MSVLPFCNPAYHCVPPRSKMDPRRAHVFLFFLYNHGSDCFKIMDAETGRVVHSRDFTWHQAGTTYFPSPDSRIGNAPFIIRYRKAGFHVHPADICSYCHACRRFSYRRTGACISRRRPAPLSTPPASILDRVVRELGHEVDVRMPGHTAGETRAMRDSHHRMGLTSHAALAQGLVTREAFGEAFREHTLPKPEADLTTAPASDLPTPSTTADAEASEHTEIWRGCRAREFSGLLQTHTFGPA